MAHATWISSHCGGRPFAKFFYEITNGKLLQRSTAPGARWLELPTEKITYYSNDRVVVEFPEGSGFAARVLGLLRL